MRTSTGACVRRAACILVEKVLGEESLFNRLFIKYYYDMKRRNGYSEMEIAQKREALENVLIPYKLLENRELLLRAGFRRSTCSSSGTTSAGSSPSSDDRDRQLPVSLSQRTFSIRMCAAVAAGADAVPKPLCSRQPSVQ